MLFAGDRNTYQAAQHPPLLVQYNEEVKYGRRYKSESRVQGREHEHGRPHRVSHRVQVGSQDEQFSETVKADSFPISETEMARIYQASSSADQL